MGIGQRLPAAVSAASRPADHIVGTQVPGPPSGFGEQEDPVAQSVEAVQPVVQAAVVQA